MGAPEIILIIACVALVSFVAVRAIIRKKKGKVGCDCGCSDCPHSGSCGGDKK